MKKRRFNRLAALLLAAALVVSACPSAVYAETDGESEASAETSAEVSAETASGDTDTADSSGTADSVDSSDTADSADASDDTASAEESDSASSADGSAISESSDDASSADGSDTSESSDDASSADDSDTSESSDDASSSAESDSASSADSLTEEQESGTVAVVDTSSLPDADDLAEGYIESVFYDGLETESSSASSSSSSSSSSTSLSTLALYGSTALEEGWQKDTYDYLMEQIASVAANGGSTAFTYSLDEEDYYGINSTDHAETFFGCEDGSGSNYTSDSMFAGVLTLINVLLGDCPYELYWYDKTVGVLVVYSYTSYGYTSNGETVITQVKISSLSFRFTVSSDYADADDTTGYVVDEEKASSAATAVANAKQIVEDNSSEGNIKKLLTAYKDKICELVSYNYDAESSNYEGGYGDPWQLVYVFDGDEDTNVVCEGYSKAFQYLCDLTWPDNDPVICYTVTGTLSGGSHMWNVVQIAGETGSYLVDVTNSESTTVGKNGDLFLAYNDSSVVSGSYDSGYTFTITLSSSSTSTVIYVYDGTDISLYGANILTLADTAFDSTLGSTTLTASNTTVTLDTTTYTYDGTAKEPGVTVTCTADEENEDGSSTGSSSTVLTQGTDYTVAYSDNTDVGTATVTVTGTGSYLGTLTDTFTITAASISGATVTPEASAYAYTGSAIEPDVTVTVTLNGSAVTLTKGTDYTVTYTNNTDAGTATVTVTGTGNFTDTASTTFTITQYSLDNYAITLGDEEDTTYTYNGAAKEPAVTVTLTQTGSSTGQASTLTQNTDYTVTYANNTDAGTATVTVTGMGDYTGTLTASFTIGAADISSASVALSGQTYTGSAFTPAPTVTYTLNGSTVTLTKGTDYTVVYANNTNAGTATVTITGTGNYTGTVTGTFTIAQQALSSSRVTLSATSYTYDGSTKTPTVTVKNSSGTTLTSGTDYTVTYASGRTSQGTYAVTVTGTGNYSGTVSLSFTIAKQALSSSRVTLSAASYTYDGSTKTPTVTVKNASGTTLTSGTDYTVTYASGRTSQGTYAITVTGTGNYSGTVSKSFTIAQQALSSSRVTLSATSYTYDGSAKTPTVTVKNASGTTLTLNTDYTVSYASGRTNAGTYNITITGKGNYSGTVTKSFTIAQQVLSASLAALSATSYTYDGSAKTPTVTVKNSSGTTLASGTHYTVTYASGRTNVGTYSVTITGKGNYSGTITKSFTIAQQALSSSRVTLSATSYTYSGSAKKPTVTVKNSSGTKLTSGTDYTVTYASGRKNVGTYTVTITGKGNYSGTVSKTFKIKKASQTLKVTTAAKTVKYTTVKKKKTTVKPVTKVSGAKTKLTYTKSSGKSYFTVNKSTGKITVKKGTPKGTYKIKIKVKAAATTNYSSASKTVTVTIKVK